MDLERQCPGCSRNRVEPAARSFQPEFGFILGIACLFHDFHRRFQEFFGVAVRLVLNDEPKGSNERILVAPPCRLFETAWCHWSSMNSSRWNRHVARKESIPSKNSSTRKSVYGNGISFGSSQIHRHIQELLPSSSQNVVESS